jgi:glutathione S-transferase
LVASGGIIVGITATVVYYYSNRELKNTPREEQLLQDVSNPAIRRAFITLRTEREELLEQLQETSTRSNRVISEIHAEREELLHQLLDKDRFVLTYFDSRGRAEQIRIFLAECGAQYTDTRVTDETWTSTPLRESTPLGVLPILEHNGRVFGESIGIMIYLAKIYERWPTKPETETVAVMIMTASDDIRRVAYDVEHSDKEKSSQRLLEVLQEKLPRFEKLLERDGFFTSGRLTAADICFWDVLDQIINFSPDAERIITSFTQIQLWRKRISELPRIAKYLATRK